MTNDFKSLKPKDRMMVLQAMKKGLHAGIRKLITAKTYTHFRVCLNSDKEFSPDEVWNSLPDKSRDHFKHAAEYLEKINSLIGDDLKSFETVNLEPVKKTKKSKKE